MCCCFQSLYSLPFNPILIIRVSLLILLNFFTGGIYESVSNIEHYFDLKTENKKLLEENNRLKTLLYNEDQTIRIDTLMLS